MTSMWSTQSVAGRVNPDTLHDQLSHRLSALNALLPKLAVQDKEVSSRDMVQARSRTALSCRLDARMSEEGASSGASLRNPIDVFFSQPELLEHTLSFLHSPAMLARVGAVCSLWYTASRSGALWEAQLRASGCLDGPHPAMRELPHEEEWTLFETAARIERHGCRPIDNAGPPTLGRIDAFVDDLAAYQLLQESDNELARQQGVGGGGGGGGGAGGAGQGQGQANNNNPQQAGAPPGGAAAAAAANQPPADNVHSRSQRPHECLARHATRGEVMIRSLNASQSRCFSTYHEGGATMPRATSMHLHPTLQVIAYGEDAAVHLVLPAPPPSLEAYLKQHAVADGEAHAILCQLAHGLHSLHSQGFAHGAVLLPHITHRETAYMPHVALDRVYACRPVSEQPRRALPRAGRHAANETDAAAPAAAAPAASAPAAAAPAAAAPAAAAPAAAAPRQRRRRQRRRQRRQRTWRPRPGR